MWDEVQNIEEIDLERHMNDCASRLEMVSTVQKRYSYVQKILLKSQVLSEKDFQTVFSAFESMVDSLNQKKLKENQLSKSI